MLNSESSSFHTTQGRKKYLDLTPKSYRPTSVHKYIYSTVTSMSLATASSYEVLQTQKPKTSSPETAE
jgi:hypothetical protein